jgi:molybdopterin-guanine dinucleotide biosynthesis protein A
MSHRIPAVLFLPPSGETGAEIWMAHARLAACRDTVERLRSTQQANPILVLAAEEEDRAALSADGVEVLAPLAARDPFHFGNALTAVSASLGQGPIAYFGGASAPLVSSRLLHDVLSDAGQTGRPPTAWVNNTLSTDWAVLSSSEGLAKVAAALATDNPLGWTLEREAGYHVVALPASAETLADIDTPADVLLLAQHPQVGSALKAFLADAAAHRLLEKVDALRRLMSTPASTLAIIGRSSSAIWREIERRRQIWVRLFVEERGMLASGRAERGEVRSLIGELLDDWGPERFVDRLARMADGLLWDNRVWMAHRGLWPSAADRFASDLEWAENVKDPDLARLTAVLREAGIPILTGGHSLVSGSLLALLESLAPPDVA